MIRDEMGDFYSGLSKELVTWRPSLNGLQFKAPDITTASQRRRDPSGSKKSKWGKSTGTRWLHNFFFPNQMEFGHRRYVKVLKFFIHFHERAMFEKSLNATFIALIPKNNKGNECKRFQTY